MIQARPRKEAGWTVELFPYRGVEMEASKERIFLSVDAVSKPPEKRRPELSADSAPEYDCRPRSTYVPCLPVMFGPNITGETDTTGTTCFRNPAGAFYNTLTTLITANTNERSGVDINMNAQLSNSIFGGSDTVQPSSLRSLACIKY